MKTFKVVLTLIFILSVSTFAQEELEKMPTVKGGMQELAKNIKYPETAKKEGITGKVFVKAMIDENGDVVKTEVVKSVDKDLDVAAIGAVQHTKFTPGVKDGKNVKAEITIPINFKLDDCKKKS